MLNAITAIFLFLNALPASDASAVYKKYFGEMNAIVREIVNPDTADTSRRYLTQRLQIEIEISKELSALARIVRNDISSSMTNLNSSPSSIEPTWRKLALRTIRNSSEQELEILMSRLRHKDQALQSMALIDLTRRLKAPEAVNRDSLRTARQALALGELSELFQNLYDRTRAVEPAFTAVLRDKTIDREMASELSRTLRQTLASQ